MMPDSFWGIGQTSTLGPRRTTDALEGCCFEPKQSVCPMLLGFPQVTPGMSFDRFLLTKPYDQKKTVVCITRWFQP